MGLESIPAVGLSVENVADDGFAAGHVGVKLAVQIPHRLNVPGGNLLLHPPEKLRVGLLEGFQNHRLGLDVGEAVPRLQKGAGVGEGALDFSHRVRPAPFEGQVQVGVGHGQAGAVKFRHMQFFQTPAQGQQGVPGIARPMDVHPVQLPFQESLQLPVGFLRQIPGGNQAEKHPSQHTICFQYPVMGAEHRPFQNLGRIPVAEGPAAPDQIVDVPGGGDFQVENLPGPGLPGHAHIGVLRVDASHGDSVHIDLQLASHVQLQIYVLSLPLGKHRLCQGNPVGVRLIPELSCFQHPVLQELIGVYTGLAVSLEGEGGQIPEVAGDVCLQLPDGVKNPPPGVHDVKMQHIGSF